MHFWPNLKKHVFQFLQPLRLGISPNNGYMSYPSGAPVHRSATGWCPASGGQPTPAASGGCPIREPAPTVRPHAGRGPRRRDPRAPLAHPGDRRRRGEAAAGRDQQGRTGRLAVQFVLCTDVPAYSDTLGTRPKCHCNQIVTVSRGNLLTNQSFGTCQKCHCKCSLTVNGVTVSGDVCTRSGA